MARIAAKGQGAKFMAVLRAMNAERPHTPESEAELRKAGEAFREACEETPGTPRS